MKNGPERADLCLGKYQWYEKGTQMAPKASSLLRSGFVSRAKKVIVRGMSAGHGLRIGGRQIWNAGRPAAALKDVVKVSLLECPFVTLIVELRLLSTDIPVAGNNKGCIVVSLPLASFGVSVLCKHGWVFQCVEDRVRAFTSKRGLLVSSTPPSRVVAGADHPFDFVGASAVNEDQDEQDDREDDKNGKSDGDTQRVASHKPCHLSVHLHREGVGIGLPVVGHGCCGAVWKSRKSRLEKLAGPWAKRRLKWPKAGRQILFWAFGPSESPQPPSKFEERLRAEQMAQLAYPPAAIVRNLAGSFFAYRGLRAAVRGLGPGAPSIPSDDDVVDQIETDGYVRLDALRTEPRGSRDWVVVLVVGAEGKQGHHAPDFRHLLDGVENERPAKAGRLDEIMVIAAESFFSKKNLTDVAADYRARQAPSPDLRGARPRYSLHPYTTFVHIVPEHVCVPWHRVLSDEEANTMLAALRRARSDLPVILESDPPVVWCGGREGQIVEILRDSQTALTAYFWRRVQA